jgi:GxxExxY protein
MNTNTYANVENLAHKVIGAAIEVPKHLGPGLLESAYESCLAIELGQLGLSSEKQKPLPVLYKGHAVNAAYRLDFLVAGKLILELKTVERFEPIHTAQVLTYLRLTGLRLALLINFNVSLLRDGIKRIIL